MGERKVRWETLDDFLHHYYSLMERVCLMSIEHESEEVWKIAWDLWESVRPWANRDPTRLVFDCVYIVGNATGNKLSLPFLTYISEQLLQKPVVAMRSKNQRWFITERGKDAILVALAGSACSSSHPSVVQLYNDVIAPWIETKEEE